jgi:RNA-directed DNA polymerase
MSTQLDRIAAKGLAASATWGARCGQSARRVLRGGSGTRGGIPVPRPGPTSHRVPQDKRRSLVKGRVAERRVWQLIDRSLNAGALTGNGFEATTEGTPQGGPLSPLLAHLRLDPCDKEWARRGHRFVRDADASHISGKRARAGQRVLTSVTRFLERRRKLTVQAATSAVDRPWRRTVLGFTFTRRRPHRRQGSEKALKGLKQEIRQQPSRTRGVSVRRVVDDLRQYLTGWAAYFGCAAVQSPLKALDSWGRRRLRCYVGKQGGRRRYRELQHRGGSRDLAWNTCKSAHGPWRLSRSPALAIALPGRYFARVGLPRLHQHPRR